jgi:hypothetical protein
LGAFRYQQTIHKITPADVSWYNDLKANVLVTGALVEPPDYRDTYTNLRLNVTQLDNGKNTFNVSGLLLVRVPANQAYEYGDELRLRGQLQTPPQNEDFSYQEYLARQGILSYMPNSEVTRLPGNDGNPIIRFIYSVKQKSLDNLYRIFPDPEASLLGGILLGEANGLPAPIQQAFKDTGTAHIIAISGFNISIIAGIFIFFFRRLFGAWRGCIPGCPRHCLLYVPGRGGRLGSAGRIDGHTGPIRIPNWAAATGDQYAGIRRGVDGIVESTVSLGCQFSTFVLCNPGTHSLWKSASTEGRKSHHPPLSEIQCTANFKVSLRYFFSSPLQHKSPPYPLWHINSNKSHSFH